MRQRLARWSHRLGRPAWTRLGIAALAGAAAATGQAPLGLWWVSLPALAVIALMVVRAVQARQAIWLAWFAGAGYFAAALSWIVEPFLVDPVRHGWMAPFAIVLLSFGLALFWAVAAGLSVRLGGAVAPLRALMLIPALALVELARGYLFTGFPWALLGHVWIDTPVVQLAAHAGPLGLTVLALTVAVLPVAGWVARPALARRMGVLGAAMGALLLGAAWAAGTARLTEPPPSPESDVTVRLVQPNASQRLKWHPDWVHVFFDRAVELTAAPAQSAPPDMVIWPETAVPYLLEHAGPALERARDAAGQAALAVGVQRRDARGRFFNSLLVLGGAQAPDKIYDKHHLVPFGEYVPLSRFLDDMPLPGFAAQQLAGYAKGPGPQVLDLGPLGRVAPQICYETVFSRHLRLETRPDWVLQATNDAWFGQLTGPYQHLAQARLRAVEQGLPVLRAANTGVSAVIDAHGRVVQALPLGQAGYLDTAVPAALAPTGYARRGDTPVVLILIGVALLIGAAAQWRGAPRDG